MQIENNLNNEEFLNIFKAENDEILKEFNDTFLRYEKSNEFEDLNILLRQIHSVKGSARMAGFTVVQDMAHRLEDLLIKLKDNSLYPLISSRILGCADTLSFLIKNIENTSLMSIGKDFLDNFPDYFTIDKKTNFDFKLSIKNYLFAKYIVSNEANLKNCKTKIKKIIKEEKDIKNSILKINVYVSGLWNSICEIDTEEFDFSIKIKNEIITIIQKISRFVENKEECTNEEYLNVCNEIADLFNDFEQIINKAYEIVNSVNSPLSSNPKISIDFILKKIYKIKTDNNIIQDIISEIKDIKSTDEKPLNETYNIILQILNKIRLSDKTADNNILNAITAGLNLIKKNLERKNVSDDLMFVNQRLAIAEQMIKVDLPKQPKENLFNKKNSAIQDIFKALASQNTIKTLRIDIEQLDLLYGKIEQLTILENESRKYFSEIKEKFIQLEEKNTNTIYKTLKEINEVKIKKEQIDDNLHNVINEIKEIVKKARLLPLSTVIHVLPRMIRDIAMEEGKEVGIEITGTEITLDKRVLEEIKMPLIQIVRNSVSHGIESKEEREKLNKTPIGKITVKAQKFDNKVTISIKDDGRGLNLELLKKKAIENGTITKKEANTMSDEKAAELVFVPGISTRDTVTEISGRGIGLDIVKTKIEQLNGKLLLNSKKNEGTEIIIEINLGMFSEKCIIFKLEQNLYALPYNDKITTVIADASDFLAYGKKKKLNINSNFIDYYDMGYVIKIREENQIKKKQPTLIIEKDSGDAYAMGVDEIFEVEELYEKSTNTQNSFIIATAISALGENVSVLGLEKILNPFDLKRNSINNKPLKDIKILLVEDSKTTLFMLQKTLNTEGFFTKGYSKVEYALKAIKKYDFDLIISDIEMPEINGIEFVKILRKDDKYKNIPVFFVSMLKSSVLSELNDNNISYLNKLDFDKVVYIQMVKDILKNSLIN